MRILDVTPISNTAQFPIKKGTLQFLQDANKEIFASILKALIGTSYSGSTVYVLSGCVNSGSYPVYNITSGVVFYFGEVFQVDAAVFNAGSNVAIWSLITTQYTTNADPVTFTDTTIHNVHNVRQFQITAGASGSGIKNYSDSVFYPFAIQTYADLVALNEKTRAEAVEIVLAASVNALRASYGAFVAPTLTTDWANSGSTNPAGYAKDGGDTVASIQNARLKGLVIYTGASGTNSTIFTLPVGFRPSHESKFLVPYILSGGATYDFSAAGTFNVLTVKVKTNGDVQLMIVPSAGIEIDLSSITFRTA